MKFIYFYSGLYKEFSDHISDSLGIANIPYESFLIDDLTKDVKSEHTFLSGQSVKIELIIKAIESNLGSDLVFIDATVFINPNTLSNLKKYFETYKDFDLCWQLDSSGLCYNIGVTKIKCNSKMLNFFKSVLSSLINEKSWDQQVCNELYQKNKSNIHFKCFDKKIICDGMVKHNGKNQRIYNSLKDKPKSLAWDILLKHFGNFYILKHTTQHLDRSLSEIASERRGLLKKLF